MIYITGSTGQVGNELRSILGQKAIYLTRDKLDLSNLELLENFLKSTNIETIINAAAYTQVDKAEEERPLAKLLNEEAPALIAKYSALKNFKFIHYSTDYVFNGEGNIPYDEQSIVDPVNYYGETKLLGEAAVLRENPDSLVIRTSWVYSTFGRNFIKTILKLGSEKDCLKIVYDQVGTLTSAKDLAEITLLSRELKGVFHYSNEGVTSWYDVAFELKRLKKFKASLEPILSHDYPTIANRPRYTVLNKNKLKSALGIRIPHWTESLELCLQKLS